MDDALNSRAALWTGRILSIVAVLFLVMDGAIKLVPIQPVTDSLRELGYPTSDSFARFRNSPAASARERSGRSKGMARCALDDGRHGDGIPQHGGSHGGSLRC